MSNPYKVIYLKEFGGPSVLELGTRQMPEPKDAEVLIEVKAFGVNRPDIFQRKGHYPAPSNAPADILGLEVAGVIVACGPLVQNLQVGDRVCALLGGGGYAQFALAEEGHCLPLGDELTFEQGAAIPETLFTVWHNVFQLGALEKGQKVLVHGGSGGIGTMAIQLCNLFGAEVYATAGSPERAAACEKLGAKQCINYKKQDFSLIWNKQKFNVILDSVGGNYFDKNLSLLAESGRLVQINAVQGRHVSLDLMKLMSKRWMITGSTLRPRDKDFKSDLRAEIQEHVWHYFLPQKDNTSHIAPVIHAVWPAEKIAEAHRLLENAQVFGKIVLKW